MQEKCYNILQYIDNQLSKTDEINFEEHLNLCKSCQEFISLYGASYKNYSSPQNLNSLEKQNIWNKIENTLESNLETSWQLSKKWLIVAAIILFLLNTFSFFTILSNNSNLEQVPLAVENSEESLFENSALDNIILAISENGETSNE